MSALTVQPLNSSPKNFWLEQVVPLVLTVFSFIVLWAVLHGEILLLNHFSPSDPLFLQVLWTDVLVGLTIYLKTSIDFAIFIGHLMRTHPGWKNRIAIETGTALGNALGTFVILALWNFFRDIEWLMALMVLVASLVLFKLAEDGLEHADSEDSAGYSPFFKHAVRWSKAILSRINRVFAPILSRLIPHATLNVTKSYNVTGLLVFSASIPFILGLDDFAGYVPLFSVVHVYGFAVGVLLGHMLLNLCLFLSPDTTIRLVKQPIISFLGSLAFVGLGIWGITEVWHILQQMG